MIGFASPVHQYRAHRSSIDSAIARVLEGGRYVLGPELESFERNLADYCGCGHAVGVASGTDALALALRAIGVTPSCEVISVSHTAVATVAAVLAAGAVPVLIDVDPVYYTLDPAMLEAALSPRTRAIVAVHLYGQTADLGAIAAFAEKKGLVLIEDCAQAAGTSYDGRRVGSIGEFGCFSFFPTKNLGAIGDGGAIVTNNPEHAETARRLRQYGWDKDRMTHGIGINSRLDELQAAILAAKLPNLDADNARRRALAARYTAGLADLPVITPAVRPGSDHVFHLYVLQCERRDALRDHLAGAGFGTGIHYPLPVHRQDGYADCVRLAGGLSSTEALAGRILSLPLYPELADEEVDRIIDAIRAFFDGAKM